jgi:excisionase family DNA binding protein
LRLPRTPSRELQRRLRPSPPPALLREQRPKRVGAGRHATHTGGDRRQPAEPFQVVADRSLPPRRRRVDPRLIDLLELPAEDVRPLPLGAAKMGQAAGLVDRQRQSTAESLTYAFARLVSCLLMQTETRRSEYLAPKEVAHQLGLHVSAIYRAVERGDLPAVRLAEHGAIRIPRSAIEPKEDSP